MHVTTATFLAGGSGTSPLSKRLGIGPLLRRNSSVALMAAKA